MPFVLLCEERSCSPRYNPEPASQANGRLRFMVFEVKYESYDIDSDEFREYYEKMLAYLLSEGWTVINTLPVLCHRDGWTNSIEVKRILVTFQRQVSA
jgi:hypothetical protein